MVGLYVALHNAALGLVLLTLSASTFARLSPAPAGHARAHHVPLIHSRNTNLNSSSDSDAPSGSSLSSIQSVTPSTVSLLSSSTTSPSSQEASPAPTTSSSLTAAAPSQTIDATTLEDINTIHTRRLPFIISSVSGTSQISSWLSSLGSNGQWPASEVDYTSGCDAQRANWPAQTHWNRIVTMAAAFHGGLNGAEQWVNNTDLHAAISLAMDFWFDNDFTVVGCIDSGGTSACPCGTPGFWNTNWFSNIIGVPEIVGQSCLLLNDTLTPSQLSNCTNISGRSYGSFNRSVNGIGGGKLTGANTLDVASIGIDLGLLTVNASLLTDAYGRVHNEVVLQQQVRADGIRPDGSFGQHGGLIYNGNYGKDYTNDVLALEIEAAGTQFAAGAQSMTAFETLIDGDQWMIYRNVVTGVLHWDFSVLGRFISFPVADKQATGSIKINLTQVDELGEQWHSDTLTEAYEKLSKNTTNANAGSLDGNRVFYDNDYVSQRGSGYVTTLRMYSSRTTNTECTNSQNPFGFHLSDGTLYTYLSGSEYEDIAAAWDWNLIPGTTVDYDGTTLACGTAGRSGIEAFVGGVSTGSVGMAAMKYVNPLTKKLAWQKAWFFLEKDVQHIMVNNITQQGDPTTLPPVFSVLEQRKHTSEVMVNGQPVSSGNYSDVSSLWHGEVGYVFPPANEDGTPSSPLLSISVGDRTGNWSALGISKQPPATVDLFAAWVAHERVDTSNPDASGTSLSSLSYSSFPATSYSEFLSKSQSTHIKELQNNGSVSAVYDPAHETAFITFWASTGGDIVVPPSASDAGASSVQIHSDIGLLVILQKKSEGGWKITVAEPTQQALNAHLQLSLVGDGKPPSGWVGGNVKDVVIDLPQGGLAGSSVVRIV